MRYRKFQADHLFTGHDMMGREMALVTSEAGQVQEIIPAAEAGDDIENFHGLLMPGFVNCHCHLELSHLKERIPEKTGLVDFVFAVVTQRHFPEAEILEAINRAENEMLENGIVAVGDICNNILTLPQKQRNRLHYHNFIELSGWLPKLAAARFAAGKSIYDEFSRQLPEGRLTMAPHAPYSVSDELWNLMQPWLAGNITTMHSQETDFEDAFFKTGTGDLLRMYRMMKIDTDFFQPTGKSSLQSRLHRLNQAKQLLLVHNTFISEADIQFVQSSMQPVFFCLCANANQYIENALPPVELLCKHDGQLVLGTDSLASNHSLSILDEIKTIIHHFPDIPQTSILQWATINGARALGMDDRLGSFEHGKQPGVILIENIDEGKLNAHALVRRIL